MNSNCFESLEFLEIFTSNIIFDCCKQSLTRSNIHPPTHPPTHPSSAILFCTENEQLPNYCMKLILFCAKRKTSEDRCHFFILTWCLIFLHLAIANPKTAPTFIHPFSSNIFFTDKMFLTTLRIIKRS